jgi:hypothetical protein
MKKISNGEVGFNLEHVFFMPIEPLNLSSLTLLSNQNKIKECSLVFFYYTMKWFPK